MQEEMGMTNEQYKGMLLDELEHWTNVKEMAEKDHAAEILRYAEKQIEKINEKLKLNKIAARWPAKAVAQFFYFFKNRQ